MWKISHLDLESQAHGRESYGARHSFVDPWSGAHLWRWKCKLAREVQKWTQPKTNDFEI